MKINENIQIFNVLTKTLKSGFFIMFGVKVTSTTSTRDGLNFYMKDLQLYVGCFQLDIPPRLDGRFDDVEVWAGGRYLVVCPPELGEYLLAPHQK